MAFLYWLFLVSQIRQAVWEFLFSGTPCSSSRRPERYSPTQHNRHADTRWGRVNTVEKTEEFVFCWFRRQSKKAKKQKQHIVFLISCLVRLEGFEPSTRSLEHSCSNPLSYRRIVYLVPPVRIERTTSALQRRCSTD